MHKLIIDKYTNPSAIALTLTGYRSHWQSVYNNAPFLYLDGLRIRQNWNFKILLLDKDNPKIKLIANIGAWNYGKEKYKI